MMTRKDYIATAEILKYASNKTHPALFSKIVKVVVRKKSDTKKFEKFIDKLYASNIAELKIIENFDIQEPQEFEAFESEDTISILVVVVVRVPSKVLQ